MNILCHSIIVVRDPLLELTDGWYQLIFIPDEGLQKCINTGKIRVGSKLSICCASLQYPGISMPILESRSRVKLLIAYNSTRIARPWKKLGIQRNSRFSVSIRSIKEKGSVPLINVIIIQKYPLYYYVKGKQLPGTFLSARANDKILQNLIVSTTHYLHLICINISTLALERRNGN